MSFKLRVQIGLLLAVTFLVYANSLFNSFTMDDELYIQRNAQVTQPSLRLLFHPNAASNVFRPLTFGTFALNWLAAGYKPFGYHLVNLLLHAAVVVLLLFALRTLLEGVANYEIMSFAAALLFAVHPIHTEAVSSIVGRSELLAATFLLAAWLFHLWDRPILTLACFALALLSKESAVCLLPLLLIGDYTRGRWQHWTRYAFVTGATMFYMGALWKIQGGHFGTAAVSTIDNPLTLLPTHLRILNAVRVDWKYLGLFFFPATLSCDYSYSQIPLYADAQHLALPVFAAIVVVALWLWAIKRRTAAFVLAGGIYFASFAVTANILTRTGTIFGERLAYFPSAGFCLLIAVLWGWLAQRYRGTAIALLAIVVVALGVRTAVRNRDWHDNASLYISAGDAVPNSAKMRAFRGIVYIGRNQYDMARSDLQAALRIYPDYPDAVEAMGLLETRSGDKYAGLAYLQKALEMSAREDFDYDYRAVNLAALEIEMGRLNDALALLNRRIAESPGYSRSWSNRAALHLQLGQPAEARQDALAALRLDPNNEQARNVLARTPDPGRP